MTKSCIILFYAVLLKFQYITNNPAEQNSLFDHVWSFILCLYVLILNLLLDLGVYLPELTEYLLGREVDLTVRSHSGDTILHGAVHGNQPKIVKMLIDVGRWDSVCEIGVKLQKYLFFCEWWLRLRQHINFVQ